MKIGLFLKSRPGSDNAGRAIQNAGDMLESGHSVSLSLLQEAVRFCVPVTESSAPVDFRKLMGTALAVHVLCDDARLRGFDVNSGGQDFLSGSYASLVDLMESCDRVIVML
jgi:sulfur transfer complex TusBCD TusB component (DsrH family)